VNDDCLKLTTYFGERDRGERAFVADELLDLYERAQLEASILLRGVQGFGMRHHLRTDRLLTLSEDLPVVSVAVDVRERIEAIFDEAVALHPKGLVTIERARMLSGDLEPLVLPEGHDHATKLTIYVGRQERVYGAPAFAAVCDLLYRRRIAGATVLLGVDGTAHGARERAHFFGRNANVPMMIIAVGAGAEIARVLPELGGLLRRPLVTLERVQLCKRDGGLLGEPPTLPGTDERGRALWQKLMIYTSEAAMSGRRPIHVELVHRLRVSNARGATTLRGVWGFHGDHAPHGDKLLQVRRHVPVVTIVVDTPERIAASFEIVDELTAQRGLVTSEIVPAITSVTADARAEGLRLASSPRLGPHA
jgi:PII-like signaling protein